MKILIIFTSAILISPLMHSLKIFRICMSKLKILQELIISLLQIYISKILQRNSTKWEKPERISSKLVVRMWLLLTSRKNPTLMNHHCLCPNQVSVSKFADLKGSGDSPSKSTMKSMILTYIFRCRYHFPPKLYQICKSGQIEATNDDNKLLPWDKCLGNSHHPKLPVLGPS